MVTYEPLIGEHINRAIEKLCSLADASGDTAHGTFNGIVLDVPPGSDPVAIEQRWHDADVARSAAYRVSPEGRAAAQNRAEQIVERQHAVDDLVVEMGITLNAEDVPAVLRWLMRLADVGDDINVAVPSAAIAAWFHTHGYETGVNCGPAFKADDRENVARWIIGQALDGIERCGAPHGIVHKFADEWLADRSPAG